jgi:hypothetical protein
MRRSDDESSGRLRKAFGIHMGEGVIFSLRGPNGVDKTTII